MSKMKFLLILGTFFCLTKGQQNEATLKSLVVTSDIKVRYARTMVSAEYYNDKNTAAIANFFVVLPDRAYISNFSMEMNGNVSVGVVKEKEEAKKIFHEAVSQGESAGHVSIRHRFTKRFDMKVNVEPNVKVVFNLTYEELLKRTHGNYTHKMFLFNGKVIDRLLVEVFISEPQDIKVFDENIDEDLRVRSVDYIDNKHVYIKFDPSRQEQKDLHDSGFNGEFIVEYDVERNNNSNLIYTLDGYFVHFYTPDDEPIWPKNVVFMIDVSGSMMGRKLRQVKSAMRGILSSLDPHKDSFTVGTFSDEVKWQHSKNLQEAYKFIESLKATGGTDINLAMLSSLEKLKKEQKNNMADILFFLTDGEPTSGVTNKEIIRQNIRKENNRNVMIFTLGFGEDCDHEFLQYLASDNSGTSRKIYIDSDSDQQIKNMFNEISNLLLKNVIITYVDSSIDVGHVTRNEFKTIFKGSEIAIAGPLKKGMKKLQTITAEIKAENAQKSFVRRQKLEFIDFDDIIPFDDIPNNPNLTKLELLQDMTKKTWAYLSLKKKFEDNAPRQDIIELALKYGFVTPLTSMVVTKKQLQGDVSHEGKKKGKMPQSRSDLPRPTVAGFNGLNGPTPRVGGSRLHLDDHDDTQESRKITSFPTRTATTTTTPPPTTTSPVSTTSAQIEVLHLPKFPGKIDLITEEIVVLAEQIKLVSQAIFVKPEKCKLTLCVSQETDCIKHRRVLLLKDLRAGVEVYGEAEKSFSHSLCMDSLYKLTIKSRRRKIEITPTTVKMNKKRVSVKKRDSIRFRYKRFFQVTVFFNRKFPKKTISVRFTIRDHLRNAQGYYGDYMKRFNCNIDATGEVTLSHMNRKFRKAMFSSPEEDFNQCYI